MVDVTDREIINFDLVNSVQSEKALDHFIEGLCTDYTAVSRESFSLKFTDQEGKTICGLRLTEILNSLKNQIINYPGINLIWNDCKSEEACHELGIYEPVHNFFLDVFLHDNVKLSTDCIHALGNLKIARHISIGEETLLTPDGFYKLEELNNCSFHFKYHTSWDWLMPTWHKIRDIAQQHDILLNKQIDDTFGVTIQVYQPNGYYLRFEDNRHSGIQSFWKMILEYIDWFEKEMKLSA